jgi:hypothetical protein
MAELTQLRLRQVLPHLLLRLLMVKMMPLLPGTCV